jgi:hypothetical protein
LVIEICLWGVEMVMGTRMKGEDGSPSDVDGACGDGRTIAPDTLDLR